jgi:serine/threonine protein kinase
MRPQNTREIKLPERYKLEEELARAATTRVVKALDTFTKTHVAVKLLRSSSENDPQLRLRLVREGTSLARISHPHVMPVLDVISEPFPLYSMPLLKGRLLAEYRRRGKAPFHALRAVCMNVADGLGAIHSIGLVHRDLRPETILVVDSKAIIFDLGIVKDLAASDGLTTQGSVALLPDYMPPELARGETPIPQTDLYALGVILLELAIGRNPFRTSDTIETMRRHLEDPPPLLAAERPELPADFVKLVEALLAKEPAKRPKDAFAVAEAATQIKA